MPKAEKVELTCSNCKGTFVQDAKVLDPAFCPLCGADRVTFKRKKAGDK